ncbi:cytochrome P450, family 71 subfamily B, polypeptide 7 [Prunus dulcis]|uniref:Cytochrome P450, family 71 subfamily B, polypeptide 7 n=1 Tax=Prunus dulcis TaxID=3755 RepID=A0A5H2XS42_PRUDU|nr:cytochrome P450, family 71 subfamily B, polypeptide 7 [Prunus dulcis]
MKGRSEAKPSYSASNLPPGPWKLPVIGNLHQLAGSLPHHRLRDLAKKYGPLMHLKLGEVSAVVVSSAEFAKEAPILAAKILSYDSTNIGFAPYGDYWRQLRKICTLELLSPKRVQGFRPIREEEAMNLIEWIALREGSPINLTEEIYSSTYTVTSRAAFGKKNKDHEKFIYAVKETIKVAAGFDLADVFPSVKLLNLIRLHKETDRIMEDIIKEHKKDRATSDCGEGEAEEDLVDVLLKFHERGNGFEFSLTTDNIKAVILDIFGAGVRHQLHL